MDSSGLIIEEQNLMTEPKYRVYMSNIDKALKNFEYSSEWADLISALGKLNKAISSNTLYQVIPRRIKISKRLAQCMHPALPSGVHLKALETYEIIFSKTGPERLATELFIYSAGLFPLLGYAAMNVRPTLLAVYETYFVPLGDKLRPALSGFLSGVIPGYESGLDHFERTSSLLSQVCTAVNPAYFYTCLWECVATNASIRLPAISYLLDHFNRRLEMHEQMSIMGKNHEVLMSGLCACLNDPVILVQRNTLEFLLIGFPLHTNLLSKYDFTRLVTNGLNTILRRDMSLNRRLYSWLLGSEVAGNRSKDRNADSTLERASKVATYFDQHSKEVLIKALRCTLKISLQHQPVDLKPYKILVSLLDKVEIGPVVLDHVLFDVIRTMSLARGNVEVSKSANLLFATFDPSYIWNFMTLTYEKSCKHEQSKAKRSSVCAASAIVPEVDSGDPGLSEVCLLTEFLLETISLEMYNETTRLYLPRVFLSIIKMLTTYSECLTADEVSASLNLCLKIVSRIQPIITTPTKMRATRRPISEAPIKSSDNESSTGNSLEKSKSDSKINQTAQQDEPIRRSHSNHAIKKSPKKTKKSKSYSKLLELDKDIAATPDTSMPSAVSTPDLDLQNSSISSKKAKSKRFSPSMKLRNLKGRSTPDIKIEENTTIESLDSTISLIEVSHEPEDTNKGDFNSETTIQEYSILEKCIKQYEEFFQIYLSRNILNIRVTSRCVRSECPVVVQIIDNSPTTSSDVSPDTSSGSFGIPSEDVVRDENPERLQTINQMFETLKIHDVSRSQRLHALLHQTIGADFNDLQSSPSDGPSSSESSGCDDKTDKSIYRLMNLKLSESLRQSVRLASKLLVEMSTFPNYSQTMVIDSTNDLPAWLKVLTLVSCYSRSDRELQLATISTLFDLITLLKSQLEHSPSPGVTYVVMIPLLKYGHVNYIEYRTRIIQVITSTLWDSLGHPSADPSQITALLYQLNKCLNSGIVENVIGHRISNSHVEWSDLEYSREPSPTKTTTGEPQRLDRLAAYKAERLSEMKIMCQPPTHSQFDCNEMLSDSESQRFRKFELLWEYGRDNQSTTTGFEKTLLKMFDQLDLPYHMSIRTFVTKWLQESLIRGDMHRMVCPLMRLMLGAGTKRISVKHAHLIRREAVEKYGLGGEGAENRAGGDETDGEISIDKDVYAISSEDGNIKYHVDAYPFQGAKYYQEKKRSPIRTLQKKFFGVTIGNKSKTSNYVSEKIAWPVENSTTTTNSNISLIVNPLDSSSDMEACESETGSLAGSAPTKTEHNIEDSMQTNSISVKEEEYFSSCEEETDESYSETDSETREESLDRDEMSSILSANSQCVDIKRFSGDCERVTELLSEHDRTKNRKQYQVTKSSTRALDKPDLSLSELSESMEMGQEPTTPGDEYFSSAAIVESFVNELLDKAAEHCSREESEIAETEVGVRPSKHRRVRHSHRTTTSTKAIQRDSSKRLSATSKTSSDSNRSNHSQAKVIGDLVTDSMSGGSDAEQLEDRNNFDSVDSGVVVVTGESAKVSTSNTNTETTKKETAHQISWRKTQQTVEASLKNTEILRQNAEASAFARQSNLSVTERKRHFDRLHPFHTHMLLYFGVYDTKQVLYSFHTLRNIIACDARTFLCFSMTTSVPTAPVRQLLVRHRKSIFGKGFTGTILNTEFSQAYRGCMYLDVLFTVCLYYARSFFQKEAAEMNRLPTTEDIGGNCKIQLASVELLTLLCTELITIVKDMGKRLANYIFDLMAKCKLQKIILHCILSCVHSFQSKIDLTFTEQILAFNELSDERLHAESLQIQLLRLLMSVIKLEYEVTNLKGDDVSVGTKSPTTESNGISGSPTRLGPSTPTNVKYLPNCPISQQPMFLSAVLKALQSDHLRHLHNKWTDLITSSLNCFTFGSLTNIVISVIHQLCANVDQIAKGIKNTHIPPDYVVAQLQAITVLCHYCLLDNTQQTTLTHLFNQAPQIAHSSNTGQILHSIVQAILSPPQSTELQTRSAQLLAARNAVLSHLPVIVGSVARLWDTTIGQSRNVKQQILEFLSPISLTHGTNFLAAVSVTWQERADSSPRRDSDPIIAVESITVSTGRKQSINDPSAKSLPQACSGQLSLVKLVSSIRVMPMDSFVQTLHQVVKSPPNIHHPPIGLSIEVSALELFYFYMKQTAPTQLADCWPSLLVLLRDGISLIPPAQFVILVILNEFLQRSPQLPFSDRKDLRDLHDVTARLVEAVSNVAGARLEQTTWLRRNLAVKEDIPHLHLDGNFKETSLPVTGNQQYSVQAQSVMAALLANLLDVAYGYQEKDKVVTIITTLMYNITPYLKNHTTRNIPSFYACSQLLATLSGFQYTRKAWRKDMVDLLLDPLFFQMDLSCLPFWKTILDNLMTYDNTTFRELMGRVSLTQTGGLNIFTSREQEYEQRALLLKRLAFVIFCSELNQYHKYMPEIQEQLANSLRLPSVVPAVQAAVFLCFRVLLLRMSPDHVTSLWPTIIAEMVQVFLTIEQELKSNTEEFSNQLRVLSGLDTPLTQHHLNHWRTVQLETSKLLELGCVLPATNLPHFQMYRWAFVGSQYDGDTLNGYAGTDNPLTASVFIPHVQRIARLMDLRYTTHSPTPQSTKGAFLTLTCQSINNLQDLYGFFSTLGAFWPPPNFDTAERDVSLCIAEIESVLAADFLEKMPTIAGLSASTVR